MAMNGLEVIGSDATLLVLDVVSRVLNVMEMEPGLVLRARKRRSSVRTVLRLCGSVPIIDSRSQKVLKLMPTRHQFCKQMAKSLWTFQW